MIETLHTIGYGRRLLKTNNMYPGNKCPNEYMAENIVLYPNTPFLSQTNEEEEEEEEEEEVEYSIAKPNR